MNGSDKTMPWLRTFVARVFSFLLIVTQPCPIKGFLAHDLRFYHWTSVFPRKWDIFGLFTVRSGKNCRPKGDFTKEIYMRTAIFVALFSSLLFAQTFFEASGTTPVFLFKAGARTGAAYHGGTAGETLLPLALAPSFTAFFNGKINYRIKISSSLKSGKLSLYDLAGRRLACQPVTGPHGILAPNHPLANGIYILRFETQGAPQGRALKIAVVK